MVYSHDSEGLFTKLKDSDNHIVGVQHPLPHDGDSVYVKDLDLDRCDNGDFVPLAGREGDGTVADYFNSLTTVNTNTTSNNPKSITLHFKRSIQTARIGFGCDDPTKGFGNVGDTITLKILGSSGEVRQSDARIITNKNSFAFGFEPETANGVIIEFNTADPVSLSNLIIYKSVNTNATIQIQKPNKEIVNMQGTVIGNAKMSLEELENNISTNENKQLNVSLYDAYGNIVNDGTSDALVTISHAHHEVHDGDHYYIEGYAELDSGVSLFVKLVTPDTTKWAHFEWAINSSLILTTKLTEAPTGGMTGGATATPLNSDRNSTNTAGMVITKGVTACTGGTVISEAKWGSRSSGGIEERGEELILKQNTIYCREFTSGSNANIVSFKASWYEHQNKGP